MMESLGFRSKNKETGVLILVATMVWMVATVRVVVSGGLRLPVFGLRTRLARPTAPEMTTTRPTVRFAVVGALEETKSQIRQPIETRLKPGNFSEYGVIRNGILLHGPRGSGKTFLAEATAGEVGLNYFYLSSPALLNMWVGNTGSNIRETFDAALARRPVLLLIDEIDALGAVRDSGFSPGTGHREYNNVTIQLMQSIDQHREAPGLLLMAATNVLDGLDPALTREGRFDLQIHLDLPDEPTRMRIFDAQLSRKPCERCNLNEFARRTRGASAAKIKSIADRAAAFTPDENRQIEERDLGCALDETGGRARPLFPPVEWHDLIVEEEVERDLRTLVKQLNADCSSLNGTTVPTRALLIGQPETGKPMIRRFIPPRT